MNYSRLIFTIVPALVGILVFAICGNNNIYVYAQQSYSPSTSLAPLTQQTNSIGSGNVTTTTNVPIVLRPLPGGTCPQGYHLVSGAVCIKDLPSAASQTTPTTNATNSFSIPSPFTSQPNGTNPTNNDNNSANSNNNEENFNTTILKSFNQEFK